MWMQLMRSGAGKVLIPSSRLLLPSLTRMSTPTCCAMSTTVTDPNLKIDNLLIIGSGLMGAGVAQSAAASGNFKTIVLNDVNDAQLKKARDTIETSLQRIKKKNPNLDVSKILDNITFSSKLQEKSIGQGLLVLEAVPEILDLKQKIFKGLYDTYGQDPKVIIATNTSSLACRDIGVHVAEKSRFAGLHFFNPVVLMKLVEVIRVDDGTDDPTYKALKQFVQDIGKVVVTCGDTPGFIVNRLLIPYMFEAVQMVERGDATKEDVDVAMKLGAGYPMGPFELLDYTGLDTAHLISGKFIDRRTGKRITEPSATLEKLVNEKKLGKKTGEGFYKYK